LEFGWFGLFVLVFFVLDSSPIVDTCFDDAGEFVCVGFWRLKSLLFSERKESFLFFGHFLFVLLFDCLIFLIFLNQNFDNFVCLLCDEFFRFITKNNTLSSKDDDVFFSRGGQTNNCCDDYYCD